MTTNPCRDICPSILGVSMRSRAEPWRYDADRQRHLLVRVGSFSGGVGLGEKRGSNRFPVKQFRYIHISDGPFLPYIEIQSWPPFNTIPPPAAISVCGFGSTALYGLVDQTGRLYWIGGGEMQMGIVMTSICPAAQAYFTKVGRGTKVKATVFDGTLASPAP